MDAEKISRFPTWFVVLVILTGCTAIYIEGNHNEVDFEDEKKLDLKTDIGETEEKDK